MAAAQVAQAIAEAMATGNPNVQVAQAIVEVMVIAGVVPPPVTPALVAPAGGAGGFRPYACGCAPEVLTAERLRAWLDVSRAWPFEDCFPPAGAVPVQERGAIAAPAMGSAGLVVSYQVPPNCRFYFEGIFQAYVGGAFAPGDALWTVDVNTPVGISNFQGMPVQGLANVPVPLGSIPDGAPWMFPKAYAFVGLDVIRAKVSNVSLGGGTFVTVLLGYTVPMLAMSQ